MILILTASGDPRAVLLLNWYTGSTYGIDAAAAALTCLLAVALLGLSLPFMRWLDILPLGPAAARSLGLNLGAARLLVLLITAALTAASTLIVGPFTFIGLLAPHLVRRLGLARALPQRRARCLRGPSSWSPPTGSAAPPYSRGRSRPVWLPR